jgi:hypothetical protein
MTKPGKYVFVDGQCSSTSVREMTSLSSKATYETVKLMESGQHISRSFSRTVQRNRIWVTQIIVLIVVEVHIASCIYELTLVMLPYDRRHSQNLGSAVPELSGIH